MSFFMTRTGTNRAYAGYTSASPRRSTDRVPGKRYCSRSCYAAPKWSQNGSSCYSCCQHTWHLPATIVYHLSWVCPTTLSAHLRRAAADRCGCRVGVTRNEELDTRLLLLRSMNDE